MPFGQTIKRFMQMYTNLQENKLNAALAQRKSKAIPILHLMQYRTFHVDLDSFGKIESVVTKFLFQL